MIRSMFDVLSLLAINLKSILQIDCLSDLSFCAPAKHPSCLQAVKWVCLCADGEWIVRVFVVPLVAVLVAALRYAYVVRKRPDAAEDAAGSFRSNVFFIVFIVYRASADAAQLCLANVSLPCLCSRRVQRGVLHVQLPLPGRRH